MNRVALVILLVLLAAGLGVFLITEDSTESQPAATTTDSTSEPRDQTPTLDAPTTTYTPEPSEPDPVETPLTVESVWDCLGEQNPEEVPLIAADADRLEPYMINHPTVRNYRSVETAALEQLAMQGDSAAMVVLATSYYLQATGFDDIDATELLTNEVAIVVTSGYPFDDEARRAFEQAQDWYYKAALHGRYSALARVGLMHARAGTTAVDLGWISQEAFDELPPDEASQWSPYLVYQEMAFAMMADAWTGPNAELAEIDGFFRREFQSGVVDTLLNEFLDEVQSRGLQVQTVEPWQGPSLGEILGDVCPDVIVAPAN